jgi:hypothetical protein
VKYFEDFGLICKDMQLKIKLSQTTFLKGSFLQDSDALWHWVRLPSFLSKFGKVLTPITSIFKNRYHSLNYKCCMMYKAQWLGYGDMRVNWFYLAIHNQVMRIVGNVEDVTLPKEDWRVTQSVCWIDDNVWDEFVFERYGIRRDECEDYIALMALIKPHHLPCIFYHPLIDRLVDRDY